uniref:Titin n=1 Tax=Pygocentrus nattereri TaxID=42514 RepID=A0AAR2LAJ2_PYGNA
VTKNSAGAKYHFRITAMNAMGVGEPAQTVDLVEIIEREEIPDLELDAELRRTLVVKAGGSIRLFVPIKGRPAPTVTWTKEETTLKTRAIIDITESYTLLVIPECNRRDAGRYDLTLENAAGKKTAYVNVKVLDSPGPPLNLKPKAIDKESITLQWEMPLIDGGAKITNYIIEKREATRKAYATVVTKCDTCSARIPNLSEGSEYYFRVSAENEFGIGEAVETSDPIRASQAPTPPEMVTITDVTKNSVSLAWTKPKHDGGSRITGYVLEAQKKGTDQWTHVTTVKSLDFTVKNLNENEEYVFRVMAVNLSGRSHPRQSKHVVIREQSTEPEFDLRGVCQKTVIAKFSWDSPENDGGVPINNYVVEIRETTSQSWVELSSMIIRTTYKATRLTTGVEYQFRVKAKNRYGAGPPITSEAVVAAYPFKAPGPPGTPKVVAFTKDTMTIGWNEPVNDGGSEVIGYHIERKERSSIVWHRISKALVVGNLFKTSGLESGSAYEFRVMAENIAGIGKPSKASEPMLALDPVDPPGQPVPIHVSKNVITIQWTKPEYDGGFKITGYIVEKRDVPSGRWIRANFTNIIETTFTVSGLTKEASYEFRVFARNSAGAMSNPSDPSDPIICKDDIEEPRIMVDAKFKDVVLVRAGEVFKLDADVAGLPLPSMVWTKDGKDVENTSKLQIKMTDLSTTLVNKDSIRKDGGEFVLTATNVGGFAKHVFNVKVLDRPGPPGGPLKVSDITAEKCVLTWAPPADDGGANIEYYVVEKRESSRLAWTNVVTNLQVTQYQVTKLLKGNEYIFRVMAVNKYGVGDPLESDPTVSDNPYVPPDPPQTPEITAITKDSMVICWGAPVHDGGSEITNYGIERRDRISLRWVKCNKKKVTDLHFKVTGLVPGHEYEFRVVAENAAGVSAPSPSSPFTKAIDTLFKPGPPGNPRILDTTSSSITLAWNKPVYDGGSEITGYIVETCLPGTEEEEWTIVSPKEGLKGTSFTITNLKENQEYKINVSAVNSEGVGETASVPGSPKAEERLLPPEIDLDADLRKTVNIRACNTLRLFVPIRGRPAPEVKWSRENEEPLDRATIESTSSFTLLVIQNVNRFDSGKYNLTVGNSSGSKTVSITIRVLDTPGAPQNLKISKVTKEDDVGQYSIKLSNTAGEKLVDIRVVVLDKPGPPTGPVKVEEVTADSVTISWKPPEYDGGCTISNYLVEKRDTST